MNDRVLPADPAVPLWPSAAVPLDRRRALAGVCGALLGATGGAARSQSASPRAPVDPWPALRRSLFGDRDIAPTAEGVVELVSPARAEDAAVVPLAVRALMPQTPELWIRTLHLVIDHNPSPMGAVFHFTPASGRADLETRVRIEQYTPVRVVAELSDGRLVMHQRFVKASGGCSAPAGKDLAEALAGLGRMRLSVHPAAAPGEPVQAQLMIRHPNISGLAIDQLTRLAPQPRFVRQIALTLDGQPLLEAAVDFTLSENPHLRFRVAARPGAELHAQAIDTEGARFETRLTLPAA